MTRSKPNRLTPAENQSGPDAAPLELETRGRGAILFGMICVPVVILWIVFSEVPGKVFISSWSIVMPGVMLLAGLLAFRQLVPRWSVRKHLLVMYGMLAASVSLVGYGSLQALYPAISAQFYNASASNHYEQFNIFIPEWLAPRSKDVLQGLFIGHSNVPWRAWLVPMCAWGSIWALFALAMLCLSILVSRTWIHDERLTFPIVQLPLELTSERTPLFRNRILWLGFLIPMVLESLLALHYYAPSIPSIQMKHVDYSPNFPGRPWSALAPFYMGWTPFIVGFAYLAPTDISFSVFFFAILDRLVQVSTSALGGDPASLGSYLKQAPFSQQQTIGAFLVFGIAPLVRAWPRIQSQIKDQSGGLERAAVAGLLFCVVALLFILHAARLSLPLAAAVILLTLVLATSLARIRAEAGPAWAFGPYGGVVGNIVNITGSSTYSAPELANLSATQWMSADSRFLPMPFHVESLKIADAAGIPRRTMALGLAIATVLGITTGLIAVLWLEYHLGVATGKIYGGISYWTSLVTQRSSLWINNKTQWDALGVPWIFVGAAITWGLMLLRQRFLSWPLHPVGFVLAHTGTGVSFWLHYAIAWTLKTLVLRYGGHTLYRKSVPFVVGLILGDIVTQTVWSAGAVLLGAPVYQFIS